jgi:LysM repeat protein
VALETHPVKGGAAPGTSSTTWVWAVACLLLCGIVGSCVGQEERPRRVIQHAVGMGSVFVDHAAGSARLRAQDPTRTARIPTLRDPVTTHRVAAGETLSDIARNYGCDPATLLRRNELQSDALWSDQRLIVADCAGAGNAVDGDERDPLRGALDLPLHLVRPGESLMRLGVRYGCSVRELAEANGIWRDVIHAGTHLRIPECTSDEPVGTGVDDLRRWTESDRVTVRSRGVRPHRVHHNEHSLRAVLRAEERWTASPFAALIVEIELDGVEREPARERWFHWSLHDNRTPMDLGRLGWLPAAYAAASLVFRQGLPTEALLRLGTDAMFEPLGALGEMIAEATALRRPDALAGLVALVGSEPLHSVLEEEAGGERQTIVRHAPELTTWMELGGASSFASSPALVLSDREGEQVVLARSWPMPGVCDVAVCSSLQDVARAIRRTLLLAQLPESERLDDAELAFHLGLYPALDATVRDEWFGTNIVSSVGGPGRVVATWSGGATDDAPVEALVVRSRTGERMWIIVVKAEAETLRWLDLAMGRALAAGQIARL